MKFGKISPSVARGSVTPALPPIEYENVQLGAEFPALQNKRLAPKGKSGIPVYAGRKKISPTISYTGQYKRSALSRGKSLSKDGDGNYNIEKENKYRDNGGLSRAGNRPRLNRAYSDNSLTRLPPISPGRRVP